ncbi:FAD:protein FMN transferase [Leifsonia sp. 21MFCrub1.1]|uniref:FAD:protein FMN transferase n=1 Tax=Leifsonia sp. 21MFCrub1.1 TaxID=1798223 RepID=UPI00089280E2|nr:FAD:protein FMN transferase [Leifsonia sp. 21MFCrub1.1]SEA34545.1 thiamine biosynthesis lipoprotein [Leifsonia sp. 21MFCrub1.1]
MAHPPAPELTAARAEWAVWSTTAALVVERAERLGEARAIAERVLAEVGAACSRFDAGSELSRVSADPRIQRGVEVSPLLASLIATALQAAAETGGSVDPTIGADLDRWGYDRDIALLGAAPTAVPTASVTLSVVRREAGWRAVRLRGRVLSLPAGVRLDLGATAKARAADLIAERVSSELGTGVLVSLGGDIATGGATADGGWEVLVQDLPADPAQQVFLPDGAAMATSSTQKRRWLHDGRVHQHILDPAFGTPVVPAWRSVTVAAATCVRANTLTTAAIVRGTAARTWLAEQAAAARLVDLAGRVVTLGAWPDPAGPDTAAAGGRP